MVVATVLFSSLQAHQTLVKTEEVTKRKAEMVSILKLAAVPLAAAMPASVHEGEAPMRVRNSVII